MTKQELDSALAAAVTAKSSIAALSRERTAEVMAHETGNAIRHARAEVARSQDTIDLSAEEAIQEKRLHVEQ